MTPLEYFKANRVRMLEELKDLLRIPSVSAQPEHKADVEKCAQWLVDHCKSIGLTAELRKTAGNPIVIARTPNFDKATKDTYNVYGHYDVQPVEPLNEWTKTKDPFEPVIADGNIYGRGTSDDKGQLFMHLKAVECYLKTGTPLPFNITFMFEGEEEVGSTNLAQFLTDNAEEFKCRAMVVSDTGMPALDCPAMTYALRGIISLEIYLKGPKQDLHSGIHGGAVQNPAHVLCSMIASLHDAQGRVTIPGFYDEVDDLTDYEREQFKRLPYDDESYKATLQLKELFGEEGYTTVERRSARPTLEVNGLTSGYQGEGGKTIVPSTASAKVTCRLVPNQKAKQMMDKVCAHLEAICPKTVIMKIVRGQEGDPYIIQPNSKPAQAALKALKRAFGCEPTVMREGGSIPITIEFKRKLGAETLLLGLSLPDDNAHSPNEKFCLECFDKGVATSIYLWEELR
jgi:acetylornithine deacetylase/succinyl-diaminopimelate desuccinylase-like protein